MMMLRHLALCLCLLWAVGGAVCAQDADAPADVADGLVKLNFPEKVSLKVLVDYVGQRQGINFIYDENEVSRQITIKAPIAVPADSIMTLLENLLRIHDLVLSSTDVPNTLRVTKVSKLVEVSRGPAEPVDADDQARPTLAVTRVFALQHADTKTAADVLSPFLSSITASTITALPVHEMLIVTDFADNMPRLEQMLAVVDRPGRAVGIRMVAIEHMDAEAMAAQLDELMVGKAKAAGRTGAQAASRVSIVPDERTNQVAVVGPTDEIDQTLALIESLDVSLGLETNLYALKIVSPVQIDQIVRKLIGENAAKRLYRSVVDRDASLLVATTTADIHQQIGELVRSMDQPVSEARSPIRFYKLENAKAADVLATLQGIEGDEGLADVSVDGVTAEAEPSGDDDLAYRGPTEAEVNRTAESAATAGAKRPAVVELPDARIMADEATNTIIIVATPTMHAVYEKLIRRLDVRRPQVLIEATVVSVDTTDNFSLGVEIHSTEEADGGQLLNFSRFGLSTRDPATGQLAIVPGLGFHGALLNADVAEIVIRAMESDMRVKVVSKPSVLINDNATATLLSESEEPYTTVNASGVAGATTSFGGFASAGTNITVTPQISEGDYLKLKYEIRLSSFGDDGTDTLPPSRQTNSLGSEATIPDGHTIVVGGLTRENVTDTIDRIPILGSIPIIEYLFSSRSHNVGNATLFVFMRAVILRDDKFGDLKALSATAAGNAQIAGDFPVSEPVLIQ